MGGGKAPLETTHPQRKWQGKVGAMSKGGEGEGEWGGGVEGERRGLGERGRRGEC